MALAQIFRKWRDRLIPAPDSGLVRQSGAIPYAIVDGRIQFLIVTSRHTRRWIFPKGSPIDGMTASEVAAREAYEEAGIDGEIDTMAIGAYRDEKTVGARRVPIEVDLYPLRFVQELDDWPEKAHRDRLWVTLPDAKRLLSNPRLAELAELLARRIVPRGEATTPSGMP
jgi:8-oxo-dGTP pyrophosphatase MutT (NUDIX family)